MNFREQAEKRMSYSMPVKAGQKLIALNSERNVRGSYQRGDVFEALTDSQASVEGMMVAIRLANGRTMIERTSRFSFPR